MVKLQSHFNTVHTMFLLIYKGFGHFEIFCMITTLEDSYSLVVNLFFSICQIKIFFSHLIFIFKTIIPDFKSVVIRDERSCFIRNSPLHKGLEKEQKINLNYTLC